jgi:iron complex outermembrane receptor protein
MNIIQKTIIAIAVFLMATTIAFAQQTGTVKGTVVNQENNQPLPGVNITIQNTNKGVITNGDGTFSLSNVATGERRLIFSFVGFKKTIKTVLIEGGSTTIVTVQLAPGAVIMNGIEVTALRPDQIAQARIQEADVQQANPRDSGELLRSVAGVDAVRRGPVGLDPVIRGLRETEVGTYLDGTRMFPAGPARMDSPLSHLDPSAIESIEVVKGPYALNWGAGNMSAVRVETQPLNKITQRFGGTLSSGYDSNLNAFQEAASIRGSAGKFGYWLHGAWREGNDYSAGNGDAVPGDFLSREIRGKIGYSITPHSYINLSIGYQNQQDIDYPGRLLDADFFNTYNYKLNWEWTPNKGILSSLSANAYINNVDHGMDNDGKPTAQADPNRMPPFALDVGVKAHTYVRGGKVSADLNAGPSWDIEIGTDIYSANRNAVRTIDRRDEGMKPPAFPLTDLMWPDATITDAGIYTKADHRFTDQLSMSATARMDLVSADADTISSFYANDVSTDLDQSETNLSGSFTLSYIPDKQWTLGAGLGSVVRTADATERYSDRVPASKAQTSAEFVGNPDLDPERSTQADLWINASYPKWRMSINAFARQMTDYITLEPTNLPKRLPLSPNTVYQYINGEAQFWGFDVSSSYKIAQQLSFKAGLNYLWGKDTELNEPALGIPPLRLNGGLRYESTQHPFFVESSLRWVDEQDRVATTRGETSTDGHITADIQTGLTLWNRVSIQAGVENLTDKNYVNHLNAKNPFTAKQIPEPGRVFHLDVSFQF